MSKQARKRQRQREAKQAAKAGGEPRSKAKSAPKPSAGRKFSQMMQKPELRKRLIIDLGNGCKVCYNWQRGACKNPTCPFVHQCAGCRGSHPFDECPVCQALQ